MWRRPGSLSSSSAGSTRPSIAGDGPRSQLPNASLAVLEHLAHAGPLTVGEAAAHLNRAQSVVSEIVSHLERQGMLEREGDPGSGRHHMTPALVGSPYSPAGRGTMRHIMIRSGEAE